MKVLVAGGGIGGLASAIALARIGCEVQVLERAEQLTPIGARISLQPNALQALSMIGLDQAVIALGKSSSEGLLRSSSGKVIQEFYFGPNLTRHGYLPLTIHRAALIDVLCFAANQLGVDIQLGRTVKSFSGDDSVEVKTEKGDRFTADMLVGADGIHSKVRRQLWGDDPIRYAGYVCWRGIVEDCDLVESVTTMNEVWGSGARFGFMRCSDSQVYWFATRSVSDAVNPPENWQDHFKEWPDPIGKLIANTPANRIAFNDISDRKPIARWSRGRVTLLGDAAHPMTPNFGQGGAQAIEDAVILARALKASSDIESAFETYERVRQSRTRSFVNSSRQYGSIAQGGSVFHRFIRSRIPPLMPASMMQKKLDEQFDFRCHLESIPEPHR